MQLDSKNIIITGATSGIGRETANALAQKGTCIVLPVRDTGKGEMVKQQIIETTGNTGVYVMECDLASLDSVRRFASEYKRRFVKLKLLINNAGIWQMKRMETSDGIEMNFGVNHLAHFLLTNLLLDELRADNMARVINVSSEAHRYTRFDFDDPEGKKKFDSIKSYGQSKLANILFTRYLAGILAPDGITVNCLHPGVVDTNLFRMAGPVVGRVAGLFMKSPARGAETSVYLASSPDLNGQTGGYYVNKRLKNPSRAALDDNAARRLWELSMEYTGL